jgi:uncharacterized protein (DUF1778 family)
MRENPDDPIVQVNVRLPAAEKAAWEAAAREDDRTLSVWIRRACRAELELPPEPADSYGYDLDSMADAAITLRLPESERTSWAERAEAERRTVTEWVRRACNEMARRGR